MSVVARASLGAKRAPLGPSVTETAFARTSTPVRMAARPSLENLMSLCAPRFRTGFAALAAERRTAEEDAALERRCMPGTTIRTASREQRREGERGGSRRMGATAATHEISRRLLMTVFRWFPRNCLEHASRRAHVAPPPSLSGSFPLRAFPSSTTNFNPSSPLPSVRPSHPCFLSNNPMTYQGALTPRIASKL